MQRKRNIRLLISMGVLLTAIVVVFFSFRDAGEVAVDKNIFKVEDLKQIDQVTLIQQGKTIDLKFDGFRWKVNDQLADKRMIDVLFATLQQAEPKRPVAESLRDSVSGMLEKEGVKVSLLTAGQVQQNFVAGGNASKTQAYFKDQDGESYVMIIPGYRVYVSGIFELNEGGWKDKYVFNFNWKNFQTLKASFPADAKNNLEVAMGESYFDVKGIQADTAKLNDYLDAISLLTADQYVTREEVSGFDSLISAPPMLQLEIGDISGKTFSLVLYKSSSRAMVLGVVQGTQPALFDSRRVAPILKNRSWFAKK